MIGWLHSNRLEVSIPEHVLGQMLVLARNFHVALRVQGRAEWNRFEVISFGAGIRELCGGTLAVLGAGAIGRNLSRLAAALLEAIGASAQSSRLHRGTTRPPIQTMQPSCGCGVGGFHTRHWQHTHYPARACVNVAVLDAARICRLAGTRIVVKACRGDV